MDEKRDIPLGNSIHDQLRNWNRFNEMHQVQVIGDLDVVADSMC